MTIGELRAGVLDADDVSVRDRRLATLTRALAARPDPDRPGDRGDLGAAADLAPQDFGLAMPVGRSWVAATAMTLGIPVVTQDDDSVHVPGLEVIHI